MIVENKEHAHKQFHQPNTFRGCKQTRGHKNKCLALCDPSQEYGLCGRLAPHKLVSRTQLAIMKYNETHGH